MAVTTQAGSNENIGPHALRCLAREIQQLLAHPIDGIVVQPNEEDLADFQATIDGPDGTPFEGGSFQMKLVFDSNFPSAPPRGYFLTRIFHPNISTSGEICVSALKKDWKPELGLRHVLLTIRCLLIEPFPESALNEEAARLQMEDFETYASTARLMTSVHAVKRGPSAAGEKLQKTVQEPRKTIRKKKSLRRL